MTPAFDQARRHHDAAADRQGRADTTEAWLQDQAAMDKARSTMAREFLDAANAMLGGYEPATLCSEAMARLRHYGPQGEALRRAAMEAGL